MKIVVVMIEKINLTMLSYGKGLYTMQGRKIF